MQSRRLNNQNYLNYFKITNFKVEFNFLSFPDN